MQEDFEQVYLDLQRECLIEGARIVSMGAWIYDLDTGRLHWSEGVYDVHGLPRGQEPPGFEECLSYYVEADRERLREALDRIRQEVGSYDFECELITKAGVHKYVRVIGKSGSALSGCKNCLFGVIQDISETRRIRNALLEARDQANAANQAKSNFLATVSHELRTPLNPILGFSDLLLEEVEDEEQLEMVRAINDAGQSLIETINRIIEFAELNPEKKKLREDRFVLTELVNEVVFELQKNQPSFTVEIETEQQVALPDGGVVVGDYKKIKCVLLHLLENAAKFSGMNSAKLRSVVKSLDAEHIIWHVDVEDEGVGIDANMVDHVFDPFLLGNSTFTRAQGGAGMGLAICRGYVELMDGQISVKRTAGAGATFSFYICLSVAGAAAAGVGKDVVEARTEVDDVEVSKVPKVIEEVPAEDEEVPEVSKSREHISVLMVEDNVPNLYYQTRILKRMGYELTTATDGREALDKYKPDLYDVVLLDLHMPGIDGIDVLKSIRQGEARSGATRVPVIVLTADLLKSTQAVCREHGADEFVSKPVNADDLQRKITDVLTMR
ncbi:response regulator [Coraliomargarita algicola]|uniref:histidine kinase n=1 Tax=Coraliomargarita algicola TaxID=3092156 RepID=A0ABZ0RIM2_9BACT|nr:response regulator [Coraliomargarita sp. J2-16]WPJ94640.1 response regulator [Coraliomargarita sp. J2-16]